MKMSAAMNRDVVLLIADDDAGHARLIEKNLRRAGLSNPMLRFEDGQQILDFLFQRGDGQKRVADTPYLLLLDIRMPKVDGVEVLRQLKADAELRKISVSMLTTTDDPREVERCHHLGCNNYIVKPVDYEKFSEAMNKLGLFISLVQVPEIRPQP
jgi:CheY-like chemotaxis protein